ncbi:MULTISPECIES: agmatine deiminase [Clostridium]|uniref:agmatine deiminase n=1 Tax=Clostridium TaxID=1485 RepID=UPI00325C0780
MKSTPKTDGYRMPAEYEPHEGCFMLWPQRTDNWRCGAKYAQKAFVEVAAAIARFEKVTVCVNTDQYENAVSMLPEEVRVVEMSSNDSWMRDCGPTFVINDRGGIRGINWQFNAWGGLVDGLYFPWDKDNLVASKVCRLERIDSYKLEKFVLEGGAIHVDGEGTALVVEECLLSKGRNSDMTKIEIEEKLKEYLNVQKVIWLPRGIYLDETNEHVDNVCAFVRPGVVVLAWTDDENDPQYALSKACYKVLSSEVDARGRQIEIHKMYLPKPIYITREEAEGVDSLTTTIERTEGNRLAASYVNFYIANDGIVMPIFGDKNDEKAISLLDKLFPDREIVPIYAREILLGGGNIHCITQQQPKR